MLNQERKLTIKQSFVKIIASGDIHAPADDTAVVINLGNRIAVRPATVLKNIEIQIGFKKALNENYYCLESAKLCQKNIHTDKAEE